MKRARVQEEENDKTIVKVNAGGKLYYTTQKTLTGNFPESMIARLFTRKEMIPRDEQGNYFIDVDPILFGALLNVMRRPSLVDVVPSGVNDETWWRELDYWGIKEFPQMEAEEDGDDDNANASLVSKVQQFREKGEAMVAKLAEYDLLIVDKILEWLQFDKLLTMGMPFVEVSFYMGEDVVFINMRTGQIVTMRDNNNLTDLLCLSTYIEFYSENFARFIKEMFAFDVVKVTKQKPPPRYTFNGQSYQGTNEPILYIRVKHDYHK